MSSKHINLYIYIYLYRKIDIYPLLRFAKHYYQRTLILNVENCFVTIINLELRIFRGEKNGRVIKMVVYLI